MTAAVSVIIPTYNRRAMVHEAITSVLAQRGMEFELIVVDDGSTDSTAEDLAELAEAGMRQGVGETQMMRTANRGVAAARNTGARMARASLIAFLDSDDLWAPSKLAKQVDFMRANPACQISQTSELWFQRGRRANPGRRHQKREGDIFLDSLRRCLISPSAVMLRTPLFRETGGFDETMTAAEDYDLWLRILRDHPVGLVDEPLVARRAGHPGQLSTTVPAIDRFRILALMKLLATSSGDIPEIPIERRQAVAEVLVEKCRIYAQGLARRGQDQTAAMVLEIADHAYAWSDRPDRRLEEAIESFRALLREQTAAWIEQSGGRVEMAEL
jgi:glycosyltransferase involved in cell wall biosynthesis